MQGKTLKLSERTKRVEQVWEAIRFPRRTVREISEETGIPRYYIRTILRALETQRKVDRSRDGNVVYYGRASFSGKEASLNAACQAKGN